MDPWTVSGMKQITLRVPTVGYERLLRMCERYGVTIRALFEAASQTALDDEADPERHDMQVLMWEVAATMEASEAFRVQPRHQLCLSFEDDLHKEVTAACRRFGVSLNAALALVVMPWPGESPSSCVEYRSSNIHRIVDRARRLDSLRGRGREAHSSYQVTVEPGDVVTDDDWLKAIQGIEVTADKAHASIERTLDLMRVGMKERRNGGLRPDIIKRLTAMGFCDARNATVAACKDLERSIHAYRAEAVKVLVEEDGMTFSEVATLFCVSRQMIARVYRSVTTDDGSRPFWGLT